MFIDKAKILVKSGKGGNGCVSFRREKYVPRGGPDGGNGGNGGNVFFFVDENVFTLIQFRYQPLLRAGNGIQGQGKNKTGHSGPDCKISVPPGTVVRDAETEEVIFDMTEPGQTEVILSGGKGGRGNATFVSSTNRAPREFTEGEPAEEMKLVLELKIVADAGLVGFPNAGKSTLINQVSHAHSKVAAYPFTTLQPILGVVTKVSDYDEIVIADIPGLIRGAHENIGLGHQFLRHIERTRCLIYVIDVSLEPGCEDPAEAYKSLRNELKLHDERLLAKRQIIAANKMDLTNSEEGLKKLRDYCKKGEKIFPISAATGKGINLLLKGLWNQVSESRGIKKAK
ncbi:MAG: GTPase ObgE [Candidatus Theseobacter exili]|nr:GTPase ObgE [Candidatus Theseobacter exili]